MDKPCTKCGENNWSTWISSSRGFTKYYCKTCRRNRAEIYSKRQLLAVGRHSRKQWLDKLATYDKCPGCNMLWQQIPLRPNKRYKYVWTKDHILPLNRDGSNSIENIQPLCYRCNFSKR